MKIFAVIGLSVFASSKMLKTEYRYGHHHYHHGYSY
jgi:hypothetical protein